jgi:hypothetical protein
VATKVDSRIASTIDDTFDARVAGAGAAAARAAVLAHVEGTAGSSSKVEPAVKSTPFVASSSWGRRPRAASPRPGSPKVASPIVAGPPPHRTAPRLASPKRNSKSPKGKAQAKSSTRPSTKGTGSTRQRL